MVSIEGLSNHTCGTWEFYKVDGSLKSDPMVIWWDLQGVTISLIHANNLLHAKKVINNSYPQTNYEDKVKNT